ncbi:SseB family protein [Numidum massiliense]|uniref:SseB family protein n=1 Tax=Numidum massiliense TaxID=1522315 RepID=UPI0006D57B11|nr:SseB family protein [Numidum massiliense]
MGNETTTSNDTLKAHEVSEAIADETKLNALEKSLLEAYQQPEKIADFYRLLAESELCVLGTLEEGTGATGESEMLLHLQYVEEGGKLLLPIFSSLHALEQFIAEDSPYVELPARELLQVVDDEAIVVMNPGTVLSKIFVPEEMARILSGEILELFAPENMTLAPEQMTSEALGNPPDEPQENRR